MWYLIYAVVQAYIFGKYILELREFSFPVFILSFIFAPVTFILIVIWLIDNYPDTPRK